MDSYGSPVSFDLDLSAALAAVVRGTKHCRRAGVPALPSPKMPPSSRALTDAMPLGVKVTRWPNGVPYNYITHPEVLERAWRNAVARYTPARCSTRFGSRPAVKHSADRPNSLIFFSTSRSSNAPPSPLTRPAANSSATPVYFCSALDTKRP